MVVGGLSYLTGDLIEILITARDEFGNLRLSTDDTLFALKLTGQTSSTVYGPLPASPSGNAGDYSVTF